MKRGFRRRYSAELTASIASALLFLMTPVRPDWIEAIFEVEPDRGSGEFEWVLVAVLLASTLAFSLLACQGRSRAAGQRGW